MKKWKKQALSILLCGTMLFGMMPVNAENAFTDESAPSVSAVSETDESEASENDGAEETAAETAALQTTEEDPASGPEAEQVVSATESVTDDIVTEEPAEAPVLYGVMAASSEDGGVSSGELQIAKHSISWVSGSPGEVNGQAVTLTPEVNKEIFAVCQVDFSVGGQEPIAPGKAEIRIPANIYFDRDGKPVGSVMVPLPKAPSENGKDGFNYRIDQETDEIVITNYATIDGAYFFTSQIKYSVWAQYVADGYTNDGISAKFSAETALRGSASAESESLSVKVNTKLRDFFTTKQKQSKYENWQSDWGEKPADAEDYFYVDWVIEDYNIDYGYSQPIRTITVKEGDTDGGEIVGYYRYVKGLIPMPEDGIVSEGWRPGKNQGALQKITTHVVVRYPRTLLSEKTTFSNSTTTEMLGYDGAFLERGASATYTYEPVNYEYPGDSYQFSKSMFSARRGSINELENNQPVEAWVRLTAYNQGYGLTENGTEPYTSRITDERLLLEKEPLTEDDIRFTGFCMDISSYPSIDNAYIVYEAGIDPEKGWVKEKVDDYSKYEPILVYVQAAGSEEWVKAGNCRKTGFSQYVWTDAEGNETTLQYDTPVPLPENTAHVKVEQTGTQAYLTMNVRFVAEFQPTDHVKTLIAGKEQATIRNYADGEVLNHDGDVVYANTRYAEGVLLRLKADSRMAKTVVKTTADVAGGHEEITYRLTEYETMDYSSAGATPMSFEEAKAFARQLNLIQEHRDGVFYDLLPAGCELKPGSITVQTYANPGTKTSFSTPVSAVCSYTLETIPNYLGSGRTMLKIHVQAPENFENIDPTDTYSQWNSVYSQKAIVSGFAVELTVIDTWDNISDYGTTLRNSAGYWSNDGALANGYPDNGGKLTDREWFDDLNRDGNSGEVLKNVLYAENTTKIQPVTALSLGFKKQVKAVGDAYYRENAEVAAGGDYQYKLHFGNSKNTNTGNVVIFDVLETAYRTDPYYWQGTLKSVDTTSATMRGIRPVVYYSTSTAFRDLTQNLEFTDLTNAELWSSEEPEDLSKVTAIAIDLRKKEDGSDYIFGSEEGISIPVLMSAPENYEDYTDDPDTEEDETAYAFNSAYIQTTTTPEGGGNSTTGVQECPRTSVKEKGPTVEIGKRSNPESGTLDEPAAVSVSESLDYELSVTNTAEAVSVTDVVFEDEIPEGLEYRPEEAGTYLCYFGTNEGLKKPISEESRILVKNEGRKLIFTVDKLAAGETVTVLVPTTVSEEMLGARFENTAVVTGFNGKKWEVTSETTYHETESPVTEISVEKVWDDARNQDGIRPDQVIVHLFANGNDTGLLLALNEENNWIDDFTNLPEYENGVKIVYTITEEPVEGYETTVTEGADPKHFTITNTHTPEEPEPKTPEPEEPSPEDPAPENPTPEHQVTEPEPEVHTENPKPDKAKSPAVILGIESHSIGGYILLGAGAVALIAGGLLLIFSEKKRKKDRDESSE